MAESSVIVLDANLPIYAYDTESHHHKKSRAWVEKVFSDIEPIALPWRTMGPSCELEQPGVRIILPGDGYWSLLKRMTLAYGAVLYTADRDFARVSGLRWKNPLE